MPNRPEKPNNGHTPMAIDPGWDKDPLRRKKHQVLIQDPSDPNKWFVTHESEEPLEMLRLAVGRDHAFNMAASNMAIVDEKMTVEEQYPHYRSIPQDPNTEITPENAIQRDRWIASIVKWLIPRELWDSEDTEEHQAQVKAALDEQKVEISVHPMGTQVIFLRDGVQLCAWSV